MSNYVLITGASRGIGLAISSLLSARGYHVIGIARTNAVNKFPGTFFKCDLVNLEQTELVLSQIKQEFPGISRIINNAGIALPQPLGDIDFASLQSVLDLNVRSAVQVTQAFVSSMQSAAYGRIINITSRAVLGFKNLSSYSAAKNALLGLTRTWALELAPFNITVNAVAPGPIDTGLFRQGNPSGSKKEADIIAGIPLGRIGKPEEVAATIDFLLSDGAAFITGQNICVDGGGSL
ncbi:MAG: 3-oxoacyl-[acyl-carrier protein] reductase [Pseudomonadota bacterium]|nr:3-oxoacyl-[acyl-carrier protein] reductase [Pseudomonadota bacterium]